MGKCPECSSTAPDEAAFCPTCGAALAQSETEASADSDLGTHDDIEGLRLELSAALAGRYELLRLLGVGGMGAVFLAREPALRRLVAVKVLASHLAADDSARTRFTREARAAAAISHPNVVRVYGVGETTQSHLPYIVMQYVEGGTLRDRIQAAGEIGEREARRVIGQVAAALEAAHRRGLVHRDIKPANVLIEAESGQAYVADFGLTAALAGDNGESTRLTASGAMLGTPVFMSPEQAGSGQVGPESDLYSLGMLAYELLTGELPFTARTALAWAAAHLRDTPTPVRQHRPNLSAEIAQLVDRCLSKRPEDRPDAGEVARGMLPSMENDIEWPPPGLRSLRGRARTLAGVALATAAAGVILSLALTFPPASVRIEGDWWQRFEALSTSGESALGVGRESPEGAGGPWLWQGALMAGLAVFAGGLVATLALALRVMIRLIENRMRSWRWDTLIDVAADPDGRNGLLVSGSREFASLPAVCRREALRARRIVSLAPLGAGVWASAALGLWALSHVLGIAGFDGVGPVMSPAVLLVVGLPALFLVGVGVAAVLRESRLLRPLPRRRAHTSTLTSPTTGSNDQEVDAWYASLPEGGAAQPASGGWVKPAGVAGYSVAALVGLLAVLALTEVAAAVWVAGSVVQRLGPQTARLARTIDRIALADPLDMGKVLLQPYLPTAVSVADSTTRAWARELLSDGRDPSGVAPYAPRSAHLLVGQAGSHIASALSLAPGTLPPDTMRLLEELAHHPRTLLFRRLARASQVDLLAAALGQPIAYYESLAALPPLHYPHIGEAGRANAWAAVLAANRGQYDSAAARLGENAAFAEHLLRSPIGFANRYATIMMQELALAPLGELAKLRGDHSMAERFDAAAGEFREELLAEAWSTRMAGLVADPRGSARFWETLRDTRVPPGFRVEGLDGAWQGYCANAREILDGPSEARRSSLRASAEILADVPHGVELADLTRRTWEDRLQLGQRHETWSQRALDRLGADLLRRIGICRGT